MSYDDFDEFETAAPIASNFASIQSFRGRLIIVEPLEKDQIANKDSGLMQDRVIVNITVVDGKGPVEAFKDGEATGKMLEGPTYRKVWVTQQILVDQLHKPDGSGLKKKLLTRVDTKTPGMKAKKGNPWGFAPSFTEEDRQTAKDFLAGRLVDSVSPAEDNPFKK